MRGYIDAEYETREDNRNPENEAVNNCMKFQTHFKRHKIGDYIVTVRTGEDFLGWL